MIARETKYVPKMSLVVTQCFYGYCIDMSVFTGRAVIALTQRKLGSGRRGCEAY